MGENRSTGDFEGEYFIKNLMEPYLDKGFCVCTENCSGSFKLAVDLLKHKTSFLGAIKQRELPSVANMSLKLYESAFFEHEEGVILSIYQGKPDKRTIVLSTQHDCPEIEPDIKNLLKKRPNTIVDFNKIRSDMDCADQMARVCSVKAPTRRWSMQVFYHLLNMALLNSWILFKEVNNSGISRRNFLVKLIEEIKESVTPISLPVSPKTTPQRKRFLTVDSETDTPKTSAKRTACQIRLCNKNKGIGACSKCGKNTCGSCIFQTQIMCKKCHN